MLLDIALVLRVLSFLVAIVVALGLCDIIQVGSRPSHRRIEMLGQTRYQAGYRSGR